MSDAGRELRGVIGVGALYDVLTEGQAERVQEALGWLRGAMTEEGTTRPRLRLIVRGGRVVGLHFSCDLQRSLMCAKDDTELQWLDCLASGVVQATGYGSVEATLNECGEVVSAQVTVSHDLSSCR